MEVICAFVGEAGPAYGVKITESASVSALKVEIHKAYQNKLKDVDPGELQLFLAKRNYAWLTEAEVGEGMTDTTGLKPLAFAGAKLNLVGLSEEDVRFESTLEDAKVKNIPVHVLVEISEIPPRKKQRVGGNKTQQRLLDIVKLGQGLNLDTDLAEGALLKTPSNIFGVKLKRGLYVRQEYWDVYAILNKELAKEGIDRVLVIGSPGIGKSVFGVFLLLLFMSKHKDVAYRPLHQDKKLYYFTWDANKNCYEASLESVSGHRYEGLFDGDESGGVWVDETDTVFVHSYLFASPRTQNYNSFVKEGCATIYMNPWTTRECKMYAEKVELDDQNEWFMRYNLVGGKPRLLFSTSLDLEALMAMVRTVIPLIDLKAVIRSVQTGHYDAIKHILFALFRDEDKPTGYFIHFASGTIDCMTTVSLRHSIQHQALKDAIEILVGNGFKDYTHIFLFLVEADTYDQFRKQQFTNRNNEERQQGNKFGVVVTQYVGKIEKMKGNDDEDQEAQEKDNDQDGDAQEEDNDQDGDAQEEDNDETSSAAPSPSSHNPRKRTGVSLVFTSASELSAEESHDASASEADTKQRGGTKNPKARTRSRASASEADTK